MEGFPPLPDKIDGVLDKLRQMFPGIEDDVVALILEESHGDFNTAADILLSLSGEDAEVDGIKEHEKTRGAGETMNPFQFASSVLTKGSNHEEESWTDHITLEASSSLEHNRAVEKTEPSTILPSFSRICSLQPQKENGGGKNFKKRDNDVSADPHFNEGLPELLTNFKEGRNILLILRGPPGSGKTTLAKKYVEFLNTGQTYSTDDYFTANGRYIFKPYELGDAHQFNQQRVRKAVERGERLVIVDNTNTMSWEIRPYLALAAEYPGYMVFLQEPSTSWIFDPKELARRNNHNVPKEKIQIMIGRYEKNLTVEMLNQRYQLPVQSGHSSHSSSKDENLEIFNSDDSEGEETDEESIEPSLVVEGLVEPSVSQTDITRVLDLPNVPPSWTGLETAQTEGGPMYEEEYGHAGVAALTSVNTDSWDYTQTDILSWNPETKPKDPSEPKPARDNRPSRRKHGEREINITSLIFEESIREVDPSQGLNGGYSAEYRDVDLSQGLNGVYSAEHTDASDWSPEPTMALPMDPMFAVSLQEAFGPPLEDSLLQFLDTEEILSAEIPQSLAYQIFLCWQDSLRQCISSKPDKKKELDITNEKEFPRTVLAPNAIQFFENQMLERAAAESRESLFRAKKKPIIVLKSRSADRTEKRIEDDDLEIYRTKRNLLYQKAVETRSSKMLGVSAYYAAELREANRQLKQLQRDQQMEQFMAANTENSRSCLDLHYLNTPDAIRELQLFLQSREATQRVDGGEEPSVEVVTGKGNRSENGKSRLRPAVVNWLEQKNYRYSEINSGAVRVFLRGAR